MVIQIEIERLFPAHGSANSDPNQTRHARVILAAHRYARVCAGHCVRHLLPLFLADRSRARVCASFARPRHGGILPGVPAHPRAPLRVRGRAAPWSLGACGVIEQMKTPVQRPDTRGQLKSVSPQLGAGDSTPAQSATPPLLSSRVRASIIPRRSQ